MFAGMMSGLTIGLAAIDRLSLEVDSIGNPKVQKACGRIFPVIDKHHWMLVTLLLCNAGAMETLPLFLDKMVKASTAIILSVTLVLIFGEVIPQALCTGPNQLCIAYYMCPIVLCLMYVTSPISWPIAKLLDLLLGEHHLQRFDNNQLKKLVLLHSMDALKKVEGHLPEGVDGLSADQAKMIEGAITFQTEVVSSVMSPIKKIDYMITMDTVLDEATLEKIFKNGYSRIPVIKDGNQHLIIGILLAKSLIGLDGSEKKMLVQHYREKRVQVRIPLYIHTDASLAKMVVNMKTGFSHMAVVLKTPSAASELRDIADDYHREIT